MCAARVPARQAKPCRAGGARMVGLGSERFESERGHVPRERHTLRSDFPDVETGDDAVAGHPNPDLYDLQPAPTIPFRASPRQLGRRKVSSPTLLLRPTITSLRVVKVRWTS